MSVTSAHVRADGWYYPIFYALGLFLFVVAGLVIILSAPPGEYRLPGLNGAELDALSKTIVGGSVACLCIGLGFDFLLQGRRLLSLILLAIASWVVLFMLWELTRFFYIL